MRIRIGVDLADVSRFIDKLEDKHFLERVFTEEELSYCFRFKDNHRIAERLAARFACKEAASKAIGTGLMSEGVGFKDFVISKNKNGMPRISFEGRAKEIVQSYGLLSSSVSISHESNMALSEVILLTEECDKE